MTEPRSPRLLSLDVFRGLVILAMLFVNDLSGVKGVPAWMLHAPTRHDGMTFVDLVFPAFLFMVGMSIPFALGRREAPWRHVLARAASLVFLGFLEINGDRMAPGGRLSPNLWYLVEGAGIILVWNLHWKPAAARALRVAGWGLLGLCMIFFHGKDGSGPGALRPEWWGILGLIGWAYLSACLVFISGKGRAWALPAGMAGFLLYTVCVQGGLLARVPGLDLPGSPMVTFAPHGAIVLAGALLAQLLGSNSAPGERVRLVPLGRPPRPREGRQERDPLRYRPRTMNPHRPSAASLRAHAPDNPHGAKPGAPVGLVAAYGALLYLASALVHLLAPRYGIFILSKNLATVTWCFRSSAFAVFLWLGIHLLVDRAGWNRGLGLLREAGNNALLAFLLAPVAVSLVELACSALGHPGAYDGLGRSFQWGLLRACVHAIVLTSLAGVLRRRAIQLKL